MMPVRWMGTALKWSNHYGKKRGLTSAATGRLIKAIAKVQYHGTVNRSRPLGSYGVDLDIPLRKSILPAMHLRPNWYELFKE